MELAPDIENGQQRDEFSPSEEGTAEFDFVDWKGRPPNATKSGGVRAATFVVVAQTFDVMAMTAVQNNLIRYLYRDMHFSLAKSANTVTSYVGTANLLALPGGFLSDSYLNGFTTMVIFAGVELVGYLLLTMQAYFPSLKPPRCAVDSQNNHMCQEAHGLQNVMLSLALYLIALGNGFVKPNLVSHGADQFDQRIPEHRNKMSNFFNWGFFGVCFGSLIALTLMVWVQDNVTRYWGFAISAVVMFMAFVSVLSGTTYYRNKVIKGSPLTRIFQVFAAAFRNRGKPLVKQQKKISLLGLLDKACIESDSKRGPWHSCSVEQVEETKTVLRILPIFSSTIVMNCAVAQLQTFSVQQGSTMNSRLGNSFNVPPASLAAMPILPLLFVVPLYDLYFVPFARRVTGHPNGIPTLRRTGLGMLLSAASMGVAAAVETKRRSTTTKLSILFLLPQFFLSTFAEFFTRIGLVEFFYSESPPQMTSMSVALTSCSVSLGYFLSSVLVSLTNRITMKTKKLGSGTVVQLGGWLSNNDLNKDHLDRFYWLLCAVSLINLLNYVFWTMSYKYRSNSNTFCNNVALQQQKKNVAGFETHDINKNSSMIDNHGRNAIKGSESTTDSVTNRHIPAP